MILLQLELYFVYKLKGEIQIGCLMQYKTVLEPEDVAPDNSLPTKHEASS